MASEAQVASAVALTEAFKTAENRAAAKMAATIALYYRTRVDPTSLDAVEAWLDLMIPKLISASDSGAERAARYFDILRGLEVPGSSNFKAGPSLGAVDDGVRKSLLAVGPYDFANKMSEINRLENLTKGQERALVLDAKNATAAKIAAATIRHAQAGSRQTIHDVSMLDPVALGWVRVTKADPCFFCAMLASRGITYRAFKETSFDLSDARFTGTGNAKVHDKCGCSLKPVYTKGDEFVKRTKPFSEMWSMWGAGGGDSALRFRRGYDHFKATGEYLTYEQVAA